MGILSLEELLSWLDSPVEKPLSMDDARDHFLLMHPKISFLKNLPRGACLFDIGAGDGQLINFRSWLGFKREDIRFVGVGLDRGEFTGRYDEFQIADLDQGLPRFRLSPSSAVAAQVIEHLNDLPAFLRNLSAMLPAGGRAYLDWPSSHSPLLPTMAQVALHGYATSTLNFHDDGTHRKAYEIDEVCSLARDAGFKVNASGFIEMPYIAESLKHHGIRSKDVFMLTMAVWLKTRFVSYVVIERA